MNNIKVDFSRTDREEAIERINKAKAYAKKEKEILDDAVEEFVEKTKDMVLFSDIAMDLSGIQQDIEHAFSCIIDGHVPIGMKADDEEYKKMRADIFKKLIEKSEREENR